ncbi:glycerophosphodiester phosphodiesterase [Rhodoferax koreense]|uniref:Glycerophosphodiester phosphodiesterase n=1 Tax=Rhodoferax koreensis TaxID=1842727 RepID=A0A1P8K0C6_9BURK|nr:glycerophosphodiester phosphodiesterase [Rhodoferax koreense]APW39445.1 glycerophosphodiester phosphodiesterase [Rhodoferax koreense]
MHDIQKNWPYPRWVGHRGAGKLAPENTMAAFRLGAAHGYRMFECDVKLSADGVAFLMHDDTLDRTTNGHGIGGELNWRELSQLDAGGWHSRAHAGEPLATLANVARYCLANGFFLNIEIKPTPGAEYRTGEAVAEQAARLWRGQAVPPLLTSFQVESLRGARAAKGDGAAALPRGLLLEHLWDGWFEAALELECVAVVCNHALWDAATVARVRQAGLRTLSYTVNDEWAAQRLIDLGTDAIITDRVDRFAPAG